MRKLVLLICAACTLGDSLGLLAHEAHDAPAPGYRALEFSAPTPGTYALPIIRPAPDGVVVDASGAQRSLYDLFADRLVLLSFIYTHCADSNGCPLASFVLSQVAKRVLEDPALRLRVRLVSISFDPTRDTPDVLASYAKSFRPSAMDWLFVSTRDEGSLAPILSAYGQALQRDPGAAFSHQLRVFLIDQRGQIRNEYSAGYLHVDTLLADLKTLALDVRPEPKANTATRLAAPGDYKAGYDAIDYATNSRAINARRGRPTASSAVLEHPALGLPPTKLLNGALPTARQIALGRRLFFDRRLSHNATIACASCHLPDQGFTNNELKTPIGIEGRAVKRNAPSLYNVGYQPRLFLDARESRLEQQVWSPLLASNEMGNPSIGFVLDELMALDDYAAQFAAAFKSGITMESVGAALSAYERTLVSGNSPFDRWYFGGATAALPAQAQRGFELFRGKAGCVGCHSVAKDFALFTDLALHNTGIGYQRAMDPAPPTQLLVGPGSALELKAEATAGQAFARTNDLGRYEITQNPADRWKFRTPSLRNVALTAPYMHDGSFASLREVIAFYNAGGIPNEGLDPLLKPLGLAANEIEEILAFLQNLTGDNIEALTRDAFSQAIGDRH